ncbi:hypothetical protein WMY93_021109 [Mugilogobius chulae]|uniref:Peptidase metallopeptidase domain-containing protein n=1 Tax=Mugilogobius chulae TaxID=88201 RepID=A0AAW0NEB4_9GOBI
MQTILLCFSIVPLQLFVFIHSFPLYDKSQQQGGPHSHKNVGQKKRERHEQTTLNDKHNLMSLVFPSNETEWKRPRCGVPDYHTLLKVDLSYYSKNKKKKEGQSRQQRKKRFALFGGRWEKTDLTYRIVRFPWQMSEAKVRHVLDQAFRVWAAVTPLTFTEVLSEKADIVIDFNRYWHGDSLPFDGPGGILAHAFFPRTHRQGEVHFDYDEHWTVGNGVVPVRLASSGWTTSGWLPALASRHWRGIPDYIDAVYEDNSGNIWFFQGESYWVFDAERKITGPDPVWRLGLPVSDIQAALKWEVGNVQKVFLFKSLSYWSFSPLENRVDNVHPQIMPEWSGLPKYIDAAFQDKYGYANFLSGMQYWKFDPVTLKVLDGYPRHIGIDFFGCS